MTDSIELPTAKYRRGIRPGDVATRGRDDGSPREPAVVDPAVHLARANVYRWLAVATLSPEDPRTALLRDEGFHEAVAAAIGWMRDDPAFHPAELGPGELSPAELDPAWLAPEGEAPGESYWRVFGHSISKTCPPYELEYSPNTDINFRSQRLADAAGFYRAFGLERAEGARERLDHLSFQAEFMQIAIARELYARDHDLGGTANDLVELCRRCQRQFFIEHLGWWLAAFGARLSERHDAPFYRGMGRLLQGFVAAERAVLSVPPFTDLPDVHPDSYEAEGSCFDCGLDASGAAGAGAAAGGSTPSCGSP